MNRINKVKAGFRPTKRWPSMFEYNRYRNRCTPSPTMLSPQSIEPGDYIKVAFKNEASGESEWMWVRVESADETARIAFGTLDSEPLVNPDLHLGMKLAVSYDNIREHMKDAAFRQ